MAHELSFKADGTAELALADTGAWHKFGTLVQGAMTAQQAMELAIAWEAMPLALYAHAPCQSPQAHLADKWSSKFFKVPSQGIFRSDTGAHIGTVGTGYEVIQPQHMFDFVDSLIEGSGYHYESAGALRGGSVVFISARVGQIDVLGSGDITRTYLAFINSFDGSLVAQAYLSGTRIVCMNTLQMSLSNQQAKLRFKHTKNVHTRMSAAQSLIANVQQTETTLKEKLETLAQRKITKKATYTAMLDSLFPGDSTKTENIKREITSLWAYNDGNAFEDWKGTGYALYNAITNYVDHSRATRGEDKAAARAESAILGSGAALKARALETILVMSDGQEESTSVQSAGIPDSVEAFLDGIDTIEGSDTDSDL